MRQISEKLGKVHSLVDCPYFSVVHLLLDQVGLRVFITLQPVVMMVLSGTGMIGNVKNVETAFSLIAMYLCERSDECFKISDDIYTLEKFLRENPLPADIFDILDKENLKLKGRD